MKRTNTNSDTKVGANLDRPPAFTDEAREKRLISLAYDLVEQRLIAGTASSQEVTHFLKLGSSKSELEKAQLAKQNELIDAKTTNIKSEARIESLYENAIASMQCYTGNSASQEEGDTNEDDFI